MSYKPNKIRDYGAELRLFKNRALIAFVSVVIMTGILIVNLYDIQINQHQNYKTRSNSNRIKVLPIAPNRGLIFDRNGNLLAENRPIFNLEIVPEKVKDMECTITKQQQMIPQITTKHIEAFEKERYQTRRFKSIPLLTQLNPKQVAKFSVNQHKYPGVSVNAYLKRYYPYGKGLTHVIGYVSQINDQDMKKLVLEGKETNYQATQDIGKLGIERYYEDLLHGTPGYQEVEVNSRGRIIRTLKYVPPIPGKDIVLNLDIDLQLYVYKLLNGRRGSAIILDPKDNSILAMVSSPSYDPNSFVHGISSETYNALLNNKNRPLVNRATLSIYPPASTIKPFMSVAALQEGVITPNTTRNDPGYWRIPNSKTKPFRDWLRWGHGKVNVSKAIEESVDTFFYQVAYRMGIDRISQWMMMFGFGKYTGIDIYEESKANMPTREWKMSRYHTPWYQGDTIPVGIGQGYWTATLIQISQATSILINHGKVVTPHLLRATIDHSNHFDFQQANIEIDTTMTGVEEQYWNIAANGMRLVNHGEKGTARHSFKDAKYISAGKSGTAQVFGLGENGEYNAKELKEHLRDHALFTGFAPFDKPQFVVTVVLENAGGGSTQGAPFVRKVLDRAILGI
ncbi:penicillin-binding protein [Candidatus Photodesmus blepharus]|uniref:Peptidoglycan D,D-transpeptidase MrdA n=1 Tax=Candidatus Photodesmus blepharonis TaxID=1179155 RepID=A0A084CPJ2_9GAMM|nr:penicillin-binding protein 2 [Candidatus Photodesmus blepharus]KEY91721.1 penicillin-binding protein [Candidatus Photodesmus blepharus]